METPHFAAAVTAFVTALDGRIDERITAFPDLFDHDAVIDVPFDGSGDPRPIAGRRAIQDMADGLEGFLWFDYVGVGPGYGLNLRRHVDLVAVPAA